jgi:carbon-monoxide dehydrogenase large subunit
MGYDENAQPVITNFAEYLLPSSTTVPNIEIIHVETPSTLNPLGVKGAGESGVIAVAGATISAVENALEPFSVWISEAPVSPVRIVELIEQSRATSLNLA